MTSFSQTQKQKHVLMKMTLMMHLNKFILQLYQNIQKALGKGSGWSIDSFIDCDINILKCNSLAGRGYAKLPKELGHPRKGLINIQNIDDNECFKWCLVRYLHPADDHLARTTKADKDFARELDFKDIKLPVKIRHIHKIEEKNFIAISVFSYENKEKYPIYVSKKCCEETILVNYW